MDAATTLVTLLARTADRVGLRHLAPPGGLVVAALVILAMAVVVAVLMADLLAQESEVVLAAPFRWRVSP